MFEAEREFGKGLHSYISVDAANSIGLSSRVLVEACEMEEAEIIPFRYLVVHPVVFARIKQRVRKNATEIKHTHQSRRNTGPRTVKQQCRPAV